MEDQTAGQRSRLVMWLRRMEEKLDRLLAGQERIEKQIQEINAALTQPRRMVIQDFDIFLKSLN